jgi:hypothetical protein
MSKKYTSTKALVSALGLVFGLIAQTPHSALATATGDYYHCVAKVGGEYTYGRAPMACNASSFGDDKLVQTQFSPLIFTDGASRTSERARYAQEVYSLLREAATYYIKARKPAVTPTELAWWITAVQVTGAHESYWSHYRKASDAKIKLMRGDVGHGHGMMQIDDRSHFPAITNGTAWNLIGNLTYAMDILYPYWKAAPTKSCVGSETNWEARIRASWSSYNGGGSSNYCRWTNSSSAWVNNDRAFYAVLKGRTYEQYVANKQKASSLNVPCLMEKRENCRAIDPATPANLVAGALYQATDGRSCVINNDHAYCVAEAKDAICLNSVTGFTGQAAVKVEPTLLAKYSPITVDRHRLCLSYDPTVFGVGSDLQLKTAVNLRATPGGGLLATVPAGQKLEILNFELRNAPSNERYYKVRYQNQDGYIYGGTRTDWSQWAVASTEAALSTLAKVGQQVRIVNPTGINLRATPGGTLLQILPVRQVLTVQAVTILGSENEVYYKVQSGSQSGYIYSGLLLPTNTTAQWIDVL